MTRSDNPRSLGHDEIIELLRSRRSNGFAAEQPCAGARPPEAQDAFVARPMAPPEPEGQRAPEPQRDGTARPADIPETYTAADLAQARREAHDEGLAQGRREAQEEAYAEGLAAGRAEGRSAAEAELADLRALLLTALERLDAPGETALDALREQMVAAVLRIASARAGSRIDEMPGGLLARVESLASQVSAAAGQLTVRLNPADHAALRAYLDDAPQATISQLEPDPTLARGDVELHTPGIVIRDRLGVVAAE